MVRNRSHRVLQTGPSQEPRQVQWLRRCHGVRCVGPLVHRMRMPPCSLRMQLQAAGACVPPRPAMADNYNKRARVSLTLRLICGYVLRSLLPFLKFILWNITGRLNVELLKAIKYLLLYSCVTAVSAFFLYTRPCQLFFLSGTAVLAFFPVRPCHGFFLYVRVNFFSCTSVSRGVYTHRAVFIF